MIVNYFNPKGISLVREKITLKWASDSLFNEVIVDTISTRTDSSTQTVTKGEKQEEETKTQKEKLVENKNNTASEEEEKIIKETEAVVAFTEPQAITLDQAYKLYNKGINFVDSRDEADYITGHITNSINIPFDDFDNHKQKLAQLSKEKPLVVYCGGTECDLSHLLANLLFENGYKQVYVFFGGWNEWLEANYPTTQLSE